MQTPQPLWTTQPFPLFDHLHDKNDLNTFSLISVCAHCFLSLFWTPLRRVWLHIVHFPHLGIDLNCTDRQINRQIDVHTNIYIFIILTNEIICLVTVDYFNISFPTRYWRKRQIIKSEIMVEMHRLHKLGFWGGQSGRGGMFIA